jgi:hypothetical protein
MSQSLEDRRRELAEQSAKINEEIKKVLKELRREETKDHDTAAVELASRLQVFAPVCHSFDGCIDAYKCVSCALYEAERTGHWPDEYQLQLRIGRRPDC